MKKLITIIITIVMLGLLTVTAQAATREIVITSVTGSSNAADTRPVQYLIDGNPGTAWSSAKATTGPLWTELQLSDTVIVDGLQIYGQYQGNLKVEYWQNNEWHSFLAAENIFGNSGYGWNLIDLSYDRIATNKLRLTLTADQAIKLGGIGEIRVLGRTATDMLQRLEPVSVSDSSRSQYGYPASYLFDHDTYTDWRVYGGSSDAQSVADLGENCTIGRIKVYTSPKTGSNPYQGLFKIQYQSNNNWYDVPGVSINLAKMTTGWQSFDVSGSDISASKFRILLSGSQVMGGIKEVELWGYHNVVTGSSYSYSSGAPVALSSATSANYAFNLTDISSGSFNLHVTGNGGSPDLTWELNGYSMGTLTVSSIKDGTAFYHVPIDIRRLQAGTNYVRINGSGLTVTDCRIEKTTAFTLEAGNSGLTDRWLLTPASGNENLIDLGGSFHLDKVLLQYLGSQPTLQVAILQDGQWINLSRPSANFRDNLGGQLIYSGVGQATQIRVSSDSDSTLNGPCELLLYGSAINDGAPKIKITSPLDGGVFTLSQWGQSSFCATLDNPDVTLKLNGQATYFTGTSITLPLPQLGNPQGEQVIKAEVIDSQGRSGSDTITISVSTPPDFTVNLPEGITYTSESQITISGTVIIPTSQVSINGVAVTVQNNKFSTIYSLKEGLNLLTIKLVPSAGSTQVNTLVRKVVRTTSAPYLKVLYPADGQVTSAAQISVSGEVSSLLPVTVTVNGKAATVNSGSFSSGAISLTEGPNKLTIIATNQNGQTSQAILTVQRDSTAPVLSVITPADGAYLNSLTINVTGIITDASPVTVLVNGVAATVSNKQFSAAITVSEGANTLNIKAIDSAGNVTNLTQTVSIDTGAPAAFIPTAAPNGWTNNTKPTITFNTTDSGSGIDHYEIGLDGGATTGPVTSPYTFATSIADGIHTVQVKAVDKAGNITTGEVKVYIDTVAPPIPTSFEVIPGINRAIVTWQDDPDQAMTYRIERNPVFPGVAYREVTRSVQKFQINQYIDHEVSAGESYSYVLRAIDHAGNIGAVTTGLTVKIGSQTQKIDSQGGTVKFDNYQLVFPDNALTDQERVIIETEEDTLPDNPYASKLGPAFRITLYDKNGIEDKANFAKPVQLIADYSDLTLPSDYEPADLGIYWYNQDDGSWEKLDYTKNDYLKKTLTVNLQHFCSYQTMVSKYVSPSLDSYYNMGVSPFQLYFQNNVEQVSTSGGNLAVSATDLKLAGRDGFDLVIQRIYDSSAAQQEKLIAANTKVDATTYDKTPVDTFGYGWSLNIPWIEETDKGKFIRLADGETIKIELKNNQFEYHEGAHFIVRLDGNYSLLLNDGTRYQFDSKGRVSWKKDPSGKNTLTYEYNNREISRIVDSVGRSISFSYQTAGGKRVIRTISGGGRTYTYSYNSKGCLSGVTDPLGRKTIYNYQTQSLKSGDQGTWGNRLDTTYTPNDGGAPTYGRTETVVTVNKVVSYSVELLHEIVYPTGASSVYNYAVKDQSAPESWSQTINYQETYSYCTVDVVQFYYGAIQYYGSKLLVGSHTLAGKTVSYAYTMNEKSGSLKEHTFIPAYQYMLSSKVTEGERATADTFQQLVHNSGYSLVDKPDDISTFKGPMKVSSEITLKGKRFEKVTYEYNLPIRAVFSEKHYRSGSASPDFQIANLYDGWGNLTYRYDSSRSLEDTYTYHSHSSIKTLIGSDIKKSWNPSGSYITTTTTYVYNDALGKPSRITISDGSQTRQTDLTYDDNGNLHTKTESNGLVDEYFYDSSAAFPERKVSQGVKDVDGNLLGDITTRYHYNLDNGLKEWEEDPLGHRTTYSYDALSRIIKITLPDDDSEPSNNPYREYIFNDSANTCDFWNEKRQHTLFSFDSLGRLTDIVKYIQGSTYSQVKTSYQYDVYGRILKVTDPRGYMTTYDYDGLNRVRKVVFPGTGSPTASFAWDDATNTVTITDENGGVVTEQNDWAGRLVKAVQQCQYSVDESTENYTWQIAYDATDHKAREIDPRGNQTDYTYDGFGQLTLTIQPKATFYPTGTSAPVTTRPVVTYVYDAVGNRTSETDGNGHTINYEYDLLGRVTKVSSQAKNIFTGELVSSVTKNYYDAAGRKIKTIDANGGQWTYNYSARGFLLSETDPAGNTTRYQYDVLGNKTAITDPRDNGEDGTFTTWYRYDDLNRLYRTVLPDAKPPSQSQLASGDYDNPYTETTYDEAGNKLSERDGNGLVTSYTYTPRNLVETVTVNGQLRTGYQYDAKGNPVQVSDGLGNTTDNHYDSLGRLRQVNHPLNKESYQYDAVGNRAVITDALGHQIQYSYNGLGWLTEAAYPLEPATQYRYDLNGNQVARISANNVKTVFQYDEAGRLAAKIDSLGNSAKYAYDPAGNLIGTLDPRGTKGVYQYYANNLLNRMELTGSDGSVYWAGYTYDAAGNKMTVNDSKNSIYYNLQDGGYQPDPLNRILSIERHFDGAVYRTGYTYEKAGLLKQITYPGALRGIEYNYDSLNQLAEVAGFTQSGGITYDANGALMNIAYANGAALTNHYDTNNRLDALKVDADGQELLKLALGYDGANNITSINDREFHYDNKNQLTYSRIPGQFMESKITPGLSGKTASDHLGSSWMDFNGDATAVVGIDYDASSIGINFTNTATAIKRIELIPDKDHQTHRVDGNTFELYTSMDNQSYLMVPRSQWDYQKDSQGTVVISLKNTLITKYLKLHVYFDDRDADFQPVNQAQFLNSLVQMLHVYQEASSKTEEYGYDAAGNRTSLTVTLVQADKYPCEYYENSDRLKTDGRYAFVYDAAGNLVKKGNRYTTDKDTVTFTATSGEGVEYWDYSYDLLNRLTEVAKNGTVVADYEYSPDGLREVKRAAGVTTHYVFEGTEPIFEKRISDGRIRSYVYALGKHLARVDGVIGDSNAKIYYYHTDQVGSVKVVTDKSGNVVYNADYMPFGSRFEKDGNFEENHGFTGKEYDSDTGLYYFNARWYDQEVGRFIAEDPLAQDHKLYLYSGNNPLNQYDPSGMWHYEINSKNGSMTAIADKDDTLSGLSLEYYGSVRYTDQIASDNVIADADTIQEGQRFAVGDYTQEAGYFHGSMLRQSFIQGDISYDSLKNFSALYNLSNALEFSKEERKTIADIQNYFAMEFSNGNITGEQLVKIRDYYGGWDFVDKNYGVTTASATGDETLFLGGMAAYRLAKIFGPMIWSSPFMQKLITGDTVKDPQITVLGKWTQISIYQGSEHYNVLSINQTVYKLLDKLKLGWEANRLWLDRCAARGDIFFLGSNPYKYLGDGSAFSKELQYMYELGYRIVGNYLVKQ